uniref:Uncharacterized protein n=1 Tax=Rhizophora mucronata TaxID=61149 RepID=A0A2P2LV79_RHIMU
MKCICSLEHPLTFHIQEIKNFLCQGEFN